MTLSYLTLNFFERLNSRSIPDLPNPDADRCLAAGSTDSYQRDLAPSSRFLLPTGLPCHADFAAYLR